MSQLIMAEGAAPSTPSTGKAAVFIDTNGRLALKDDEGNTDVHAALGTDQTFTETNIFAPTGTASGDRAIYIQMPASATANALRVDYDGTNALSATQAAAQSILAVNGRNLGNNVAGPTVLISRNTNAGAEGGAAGTIQQAQGDGTVRFLWPDATGDLRIHTAAPTGSSGAPTVSDTAGTVVGDQTSHVYLKENIAEHADRDGLLAAVLAVKLYDYQMIEDSRRRSDDSRQTYTGLVITDEDRQNNAWFANNLGRQQVPVLNERNLFGYLIGAIQAQQQQIQALQEAVARLT